MQQVFPSCPPMSRLKTAAPRARRKSSSLLPKTSIKTPRNQPSSLPVKDCSREKKFPPLPLQKATVLALAPVKQEDGEEDRDEAEKQILARIVKYQEKGMNDNTPAAEAQTPLAMASKLRAQHNLSLGEVLQKTVSTKNWERGESHVRITRTRGKSMQVSKESWVDDIVYAMQILFDVQCYWTAKDEREHLDLTFLGIARNTGMAAQAFEMGYNLICDWARGRKRSSNNYCRVIARCFSDIARETMEQEKREAIEAEKTERLARERKEYLDRQRLLNRLKDQPLPSDAEIPKRDKDVAEIKPNLAATVEDVSDDEEGGAACTSMDTLLEDWVKGPADEPALLDNPTEMTGTVRGLDGDTSGQDDESDSEASSDENSYDDWSDEEHLDEDMEPNLDVVLPNATKATTLRKSRGREFSHTVPS
jgi:hypothetical protein